MTDENERRLFGRTRRRNAPAGEKRDIVYRVGCTLEESTQLRARAVVRGVTVPRLLFEAAMNEHVETSTDRKEAIAELFAVRRLLANIANNTNQLAKFANTESTFPADAAAVVDEYRALVPEIQAVVRRLADS
ncbi:plasmid mobilization protein [Agromyces sp. GXS1127]|uniref:plasmid mobilization protein n=1 Tax=Agromyces sp. GXS1127 TaxID=3424181 RepID=UPI003D317760